MDAPINGNGRTGYLFWGVGGLAGIGGLWAVVAQLLALWTAPMQRQVTANELRIDRLESTLGIISQLAAQRGIEIPNLRLDIKRVEDRLDRLEQAQRGIVRP